MESLVNFCSSHLATAETFSIRRAKRVLYGWIPPCLSTKKQRIYLCSKRNALAKWASKRFHNEAEFEAFLIGWCLEAEYYGYTDHEIDIAVMNNTFDEELSNKCFTFWKEKFQKLEPFIKEFNLYNNARLLK